MIFRYFVRVPLALMALIIGVPLALVALIVLAALADVDVLRQAVGLPAQKDNRRDRGWVWLRRARIGRATATPILSNRNPTRAPTARSA